jgi:hypothetical protein
MDERDERKRTSGDASKRFRRHQNWSCTTAPGRVWRKPTYWPRGARCIGGMTLVWALVRNLRTCPAMPREKVQAAKLLAPGGSLAEAPLAFWAEWEAPSYVIHRWPEEGDLPRFLQEPRWERPTNKEFRQNTDPWVFGDCFRYSNCHQLNQSGLRNLAAGSVILFGSTLGFASPAGPRFVLDTLFVVSEQRLQRRDLRGSDQRDVLVCPIQADGPRRFSLCSADAVIAARGRQSAKLAVTERSGQAAGAPYNSGFVDDRARPGDRRRVS